MLNGAVLSFGCSDGAACVANDVAILLEDGTQFDSTGVCLRAELTCL